MTRLRRAVPIAVLVALAGTAPVVARPAPRRSHTVTGMYDKRYCELILVSLRAGTAPTARVYNSFPYNACPQAKWAAIDTRRIAAATGVAAVVRNGPRHWTIDGVQKFGRAAPQTRSFGGITMALDGILAIANLNARAPYTAHQVTRDTIFFYNGGRRVFELTSPGGARYVMQSYSQQIDPTLTAGKLPGLARRLKLPAGWRYRTRVLTKRMEIVTTTTNARVLQDDFGDSYSMETGPR